MDKKNLLIIIVSLIVAIIVVIILMAKNIRKNKLLKQIERLFVRFNEIKTTPIAFKLNKAQTMAKRSEETSASVQECYLKYEEVEKNISRIQKSLNNVDDELKSHNYKEALKDIEVLDEDISTCEEVVKKIDEFLESFYRKDDEQRDYSTSLKEKYRVIKNTINENSNVLSIAYNGLLEKLKECEDLFSSSEEWMYASDYVAAQNDLEKIDEKLEAIKINTNAIPKCVKDTKGVLPVMLDEVKREYALTKQRGVYVSHLDIDNKIKTIEAKLNEDIKKLIKADTDNIRENCNESKDILNEIIESLAAENRSFKEAKEANDMALEHTAELEKVENYVRVAYDKDSARFGLEDLRPYLKQTRDSIETYKSRHGIINDSLSATNKPSSEILVEAENLCQAIEKDKKELYSYKTIIDKSTDGESRAISQLTKLQLVLSEVETKISEYHLPCISSSYLTDLEKSHNYVDVLKTLVNDVPIDVEKLNAALEESIDFVHNFYNNVNNIVGAAVMVENTIVFGNRYRSTFPEVDRELSKAEFQYMNGEYTKALKTAISCMETLFPDNADEKILENA